MENVERTGTLQTRYFITVVSQSRLITHNYSSFAQRFVPVSATFDANMAELTSYGKRLIVPAFNPPEDDPTRVYRVRSFVCITLFSFALRTLQYKIDIRMRNHNTLSRDDAIKALAACVPSQHKVDLENAELFILVQIYRVCIRSHKIMKKIEM